MTFCKKNESFTMTSKERVLAVLNHIQPDRVAMHPRMAPELDKKLQERLGLGDAEFRDWLGVDIVKITPEFRGAVSDKCYADPTIEVANDGLYFDIYRVPFYYIETEFQAYMEQAGRPPLQNCQAIDELDNFPWPTADMWDYSMIESRLDAHKDKATYGHSRGFFEIAHFMRGMDTFLMDIALDPEFASSLMGRIADYLLEKARRILEAGNGKFDIFEYNDDIASQNALFISPDMWRQFIKPRMAKFCDLYHSYGAKVKYHSCGSVYAIIPDLIEIGVDILNPVQPLAKDMNPFELKKEFGQDISFEGGIDVQDLLPNGSPDGVRQYTRRMCDVVGKSGGYVLGGSHKIQADTPVENVIAMIEEANNRGRR